MNKIYLTDRSTGLCEALFEQNQLYMIKDNNNLFDEIIYCVDRLLSAGFNIVYLTTSSNYNKLSTQFSKMVEIHLNNYIELINIDSDLIGKNNVTYKLLSSKDTKSVIKKYQLKMIVFEDKNYSLTLKQSITVN